MRGVGFLLSRFRDNWTAETSCFLFVVVDVVFREAKTRPRLSARKSASRRVLVQAESRRDPSAVPRREALRPPFVDFGAVGAERRVLPYFRDVLTLVHIYVEGIKIIIFATIWACLKIVAKIIKSIKNGCFFLSVVVYLTLPDVWLRVL